MKKLKHRKAKGFTQSEGWVNKYSAWISRINFSIAYFLKWYWKLLRRILKRTKQRMGKIIIGKQSELTCKRPSGQFRHHFSLWSEGLEEGLTDQRSVGLMPQPYDGTASSFSKERGRQNSLILFLHYFCKSSYCPLNFPFTLLFISSLWSFPCYHLSLDSLHSFSS